VIYAYTAQKVIVGQLTLKMHVTKNNRKSNEKLKTKPRMRRKKAVTGGVRGVSPEGETGRESTVVKFVEEVGFKSGVKREEVMAGENVNRQRKTRARIEGFVRGCLRETGSCHCVLYAGWLGSRVVSVPDSAAVGPGFKSQPRRCRVTGLGKLFTPVVPLFIKQRNL